MTVWPLIFVENPSGLFFHSGLKLLKLNVEYPLGQRENHFLGAAVFTAGYLFAQTRQLISQA
jgi:hypothetical protein